MGHNHKACQGGQGGEINMKKTPPHVPEYAQIPVMLEIPSVETITATQ